MHIILDKIQYLDWNPWFQDQQSSALGCLATLIIFLHVTLAIYQNDHPYSVVTWQGDPVCPKQAFGRLDLSKSWISKLRLRSNRVISFSLPFSPGVEVCLDLSLWSQDQ